MCIALIQSLASLLQPQTQPAAQPPARNASNRSDSEKSSSTDSFASRHGDRQQRPVTGKSQSQTKSSGHLLMASADTAQQSSRGERRGTRSSDAGNAHARQQISQRCTQANESHSYSRGDSQSRLDSDSRWSSLLSDLNSDGSRQQSRTTRSADGNSELRTSQNQQQAGKNGELTVESYLGRYSRTENGVSTSVAAALIRVSNKNGDSQSFGFVSSQVGRQSESTSNGNCGCSKQSSDINLLAAPFTQARTHAQHA